MAKNCAQEEQQYYRAIADCDINDDTIVACATPPGRGGVSVVRISGRLVPHIACNILSSAKLPAPRYATYSDFLAADGGTIDSGIALYFPAPHSFTGEDVLELQGHGGRIVIDNLIERVIELGALMARPGEFSERAFLNGKIDLIQAEAIADLIDANSKQAATYALRSLQGEFSRRIYSVSEKIMQLRAMIEAALDFSDEDIEFISSEKLQQQLVVIAQEVKATLHAAQQGVLLNEGVKVVIVGKPNAGKSSLLNCLSGEERAIVTPIAGTTRDVIRTQVRLYGGVVLELLDTAGLRALVDGVEAVCDAVEQEGMRRARAEIAMAQYILLVVDCSAEGIHAPQRLVEEYGEYLALATPHLPNNLIIVYNKIDLLQNKESHAAKIAVVDGISCVFLSAQRGQGIDLLQQVLQERVGAEQTNEDGFSARRRHLLALQEVEQHLVLAQELLVTTTMAALQTPIARSLDNSELVAEELREAQQVLGTITGAVTTEDLLDVVFRDFCVGK